MKQSSEQSRARSHLMILLEANRKFSSVSSSNGILMALVHSLQMVLMLE
jgi:hypothetical protein